jgi:hypothetical protein
MGGNTSPITLISEEILLMDHRERQEPSEPKDIGRGKRMHHSLPPNKRNHHRPEKNVRKHQIHPETQVWQPHDNTIIRKQKDQQNTHSNSTIILLLLIPCPAKLTIKTSKGGPLQIRGRCVPSRANNSSQYSSNRTRRSSTSKIFSSHLPNLSVNSPNLHSNWANRSHGACRWSLRVCRISSARRSAVVRNLSRRVCRSVRSFSARSSLIYAVNVGGVKGYLS